jgi:hypothetical protein
LCKSPRVGFDAARFGCLLRTLESPILWGRYPPIALCDGGHFLRGTIIRPRWIRIWRTKKKRKREDTYLRGTATPHLLPPPFIIKIGKGGRDLFKSEWHIDPHIDPHIFFGLVGYGKSG